MWQTRRSTGVEGDHSQLLQFVSAPTGLGRVSAWYHESEQEPSLQTLLLLLACQW